MKLNLIQIMILNVFVPGIGGCNMDDMPEIDNGRKVIEEGYRGSVFRYKCKARYKLFGYNGPISCEGNKKWSKQTAPVCTRK